MNGQFLFRSLDQGTTWEQRPLLPDVVRGNPSSSFVSPDEGWVLNSGPPATQCMAQGVALWHTADAGATWQLLPATGIAFQQCKSELSFVDARRGFLAAGDPNTPPVIYWTGDGGLTWQPSAPLPDPPGVTTSGGGFTLRAHRVRALGAALLVPVAAPGRTGLLVYRSDDGGAIWTYLAQSLEGEGALALVTQTRWIVLAPPSESSETTDAGRTWHPLATDYAQAAPIPPTVTFADGAVGYATVRGAIQRTLDGGVHWSPVRSPGT
jgi:photosystem II stability/assembly factor-like uncharacterized protein